jgi:heme oxygenase
MWERFKKHLDGWLMLALLALCCWWLSELDAKINHLRLEQAASQRELKELERRTDELAEELKLRTHPGWQLNAREAWWAGRYEED